MAMAGETQHPLGVDFRPLPQETYPPVCTGGFYYCVRMVRYSRDMAERIPTASAPPAYLRGVTMEDRRILKEYTEEEQKKIVERLHSLSTLGYFIGKDFQVSIGLNQPDGGWHWNYIDNHIKV